MKIKKQISKLLMIGILINNLSLLSHAGTLSPDTRYETFEGDSIKIDNVIEEGNMDIEIEGNTLVNLFNGFISLPDTNNVISTYENNSLVFKAKESFVGDIYPSYIGLLKFARNLVGGKTYTMYFDCNVEGARFGIAVGDDRYNNPRINYITTTKIGQNKFTFTLDSSIDSSYVFDLRLYSSSTNDPHIFKNIVIIEGEGIYDTIPYFEGLKSVGELENNNLQITSRNKNLFNKNDVEFNKVVVMGSGNMLPDSNYVTSNFIEVKPNTVYSINDYLPVVIQYDINYNYISGIDNPRGSQFRTESNCSYIKIRNYDYLDTLEKKQEAVNNAQLEENVKLTNYSEYKYNKKSILLNEPLRGIENGVKDRVVKRNGQWVIERNCAQYTFDGDENWRNDGVTENNTYNIYRMTLDLPGLKSGRANVSSDKFAFKTSYNVDENTGEGIFGSYGGSSLFIDISKSKIDSFSGSNGDKFKAWLSQNPVTVVYELANPIYEPLNINSVINLYEETTYISNNSSIPANMKVVVDRILNRAIDTSNEAVTLETIDSISTARAWVNMLPESLRKDELQDKLNNIFNIDELGTIEKKNATVNTDVYIQPINTLTMSLSTNSITFEDFSGIEDLRLNNALNISINSSLPYDLNAYLPTEIYNSDKSAFLPKNILSIKENTDNDYKTFSNLNDKIVLKDNNPPGNSIKHDIDLMLSGGVSHQKDVYKTTIKFEVEQS